MTLFEQLETGLTYKETLIKNAHEKQIDQENAPITEKHTSDFRLLMKRLSAYVKQHCHPIECSSEEFYKPLYEQARLLVDGHFDNLPDCRNLNVFHVQELVSQIQIKTSSNFLTNHSIYHEIISRLRNVLRLTKDQAKGIEGNPMVVKFQQKLNSLINNSRNNLQSFMFCFNELKDRSLHRFIRQILNFDREKDAIFILELMQECFSLIKINELKLFISEEIDKYIRVSHIQNSAVAWIENDNALTPILKVSGKNVMDSLIRDKDFLFKFIELIWRDNHVMKSQFIKFENLSGSKYKRMHTLLKEILRHIYSTDYDPAMSALNALKRDTEIDRLLLPFLNDSSNLDDLYRIVESLTCFPILQYISISSLIIGDGYFHERFPLFFTDLNPLRTECLKGSGEMITSAVINIKGPFSFYTKVHRLYKVSGKKKIEHYIPGVVDQDVKWICTIPFWWCLYYSRPPEENPRVTPMGYMQLSRVQEWGPEATIEDKKIVKEAFLGFKDLEAADKTLLLFRSHFDLPDVIGTSEPSSANLSPRRISPSTSPTERLVGSLLMRRFKSKNPGMERK